MALSGRRGCVSTLTRKLNVRAEWSKKSPAGEQHRPDLNFFIRSCLFFKGTHEGFAVG